MYRKKFKMISAMIAVFSLFASEQAMADVNCTFSVDSVSLGADGTVAASFTADAVSHYWVLCGVNNTWVNVNGGGINVTPDTCKVLHADLVTARATGRTVSFTFPGLSSCVASTLPANGVPNPYYSIFSM